MKRDNEGYIILDGAEILNKRLSKKGRKPKMWLKIGDEEYLFKTGNTENESWAEMIASELGKQCGLNMASYDIGIYNGVKGLLSKNFLNKGDKIFSGEILLGYGIQIMSDNDLKHTKINSVENIMKMLLTIMNVSQEEETQILEDLIKIWAFDGLTLESDRNPTNWAVIKNSKGLKISPIYDCSTIGRLNEDIDSFIKNSRYNGIENLINNVKYQLTLYDSDKNDDFLKSFETFCEDCYGIQEIIINSFNKVNVDEAIKNIETRINYGNMGDEKIEVPWQIGLWLSKIIKTRLSSMNMIYENSKRKELVYGRKK